MPQVRGGQPELVSTPAVLLCAYQATGPFRLTRHAPKWSTSVEQDRRKGSRGSLVDCRRPRHDVMADTDKEMMTTRHLGVPTQRDREREREGERESAIQGIVNEIRPSCDGGAPDHVKNATQGDNCVTLEILRHAVYFLHQTYHATNEEEHQSLSAGKDKQP